jgi:hypothetical protein
MFHAGVKLYRHQYVLVVDIAILKDEAHTDATMLGGSCLQDALAGSLPIDTASCSYFSTRTCAQKQLLLPYPEGSREAIGSTYAGRSITPPPSTIHTIVTSTYNRYVLHSRPSALGSTSASQRAHRPQRRRARHLRRLWRSHRVHARRSVHIPRPLLLGSQERAILVGRER